MKKIYIIIILLFCFQYINGQTEWADINLTDFLTDNEQYFSDAKLRKDGTLELLAKESFSSIDQNKKNAIIEYALKKWNIEIVYIRAGYKREIWKKDLTTGLITLIGLWDLNNAEVYKYLPRTLKTTNIHPFFFYVGGQSNFNSEKFSLFLNARIGSFLYKDRWDVALSASVSVSDNQGTSIANAETSLLSKVYFPIRKYNLSPYIGTGISRVFTSTVTDNSNQYSENDDSYWNSMLLLGISWYVGPGSLDLGTQVGDNFNITLGYTFSF